MRLRRRQFIVSGVALLGTAGWPALPRATAARAQQPVDAPAGDWEPTGLTDPVARVLTPASGALFAVLGSEYKKIGLVRSDDAGATWSTVPLPPPQVIGSIPNFQVVVDPTNHRVIYAGGVDGLYKTDDDAATWQRVLELDPNGWLLRGIAVSPADARLVYLAIPPNGRGKAIRFLRSRDAGLSWEQIFERSGTDCGFDVNLLQAHPADPARVFTAYNCYRGSTFGDNLQQSTDYGQSWSDLGPSPPYASPKDQGGFIRRLVGGQGGRPERLYLAAVRDNRIGGSQVVRTDDGQTWTTVLSYIGGGIQDQGQPEIEAWGIACDPADPDRVYVGLTELRYAQGNASSAGSWTVVSNDGGATWQDLGQRADRVIWDLALGVDRRNLYLATSRGLFRYALG